MSSTVADWDRRFMLLAHHVARWSNGPGTKVGAVIVGPSNEVRATGFSGFPRGVNEAVNTRHERKSGERLMWVCHAEQNAIYNAARSGTALQGCRIYVPWFPCADCAKAIIQAGLVELVSYEPDFSHARWGKHFQCAYTMLHEAGVRARYVLKLMNLKGDGS